MRSAPETRIRVLLFSTVFPNAAQPTHGLFVRERMRGLPADAVEVRVVAPTPWFPFVSGLRPGLRPWVPRKEEQDGAPLLRWHAIAGAFAANLGGTMPPAASPCGTVMARNQMLLFNEAERVFPDLREAKPRIYENLLAPFEVGGRPAGTVWAIKHTPEGRFEPEDARLLARLAHVASAAYQMTTALAEAQQGRKALERRVEARTRELTRANECLAASEKRFRRAMGIGTVGALFFNLNGRMTDANAAF